jgi:peptidoglycan/LPS O-acetylase OafA/YrhL
MQSTNRACDVVPVVERETRNATRGISAIEPARAPKLHALTGMRFLAAALVAFHHFSLLSGVYPKTPSINLLLGLGYISVNFFFILSGFVLAYNYIDDAGRFSVSRRMFWMARFARLYPAYALALLFALPSFIELAMRAEAPAAGAPALDTAWVIVGTTATTLLLLQDWFGLVAWNAVGWSLSVEAFFYFTFPYVAPRIGRATDKGLALLALVCSLVPVVLALLVFGGQLRGGHRASWYEVSTLTEGFFYASPTMHFPEFILGVIVGRLFRRRFLAGKMSRWNPAWDYLAAGSTVALLGLLSVLPGPIFITLTPPVFAWLVFSLAHSCSKMARILSAPLLLLLGNASYSLYLFHATGIHALLSATAILGLVRLVSWPLFLLALAVIVLFSIAVHKWIEEPLRHWIRLRLSPEGPLIPASALRMRVDN